MQQQNTMELKKDLLKHEKALLIITEIITNMN